MLFYFSAQITLVLLTEGVEVSENQSVHSSVAVLLPLVFTPEFRPLKT